MFTKSPAVVLASTSANSTLVEECKAAAEGVASIGLVTNYWKELARQAQFWREHPDHHGNASREKPLFKDDIMKLFIDTSSEKQAKEMLDPKLALALAVRHKYFGKAISKGVKSKNDRTLQIVILGSGYDTRPVRKQKYTAQFGARFFEIDKKSVLDNKKAIYDRNKIYPNAVYVGIDYLEEDFIEHLKKAGLNTTLSTHFIWEGNTMYISKDKVRAILERIKKEFSGSVNVSLDYLSQSVVDKMASIRETDVMIDKFKKSQAPMINGYKDIRNELADDLGFTVVDNQTCASMTSQYGVGDKPYVSQEQYFLCTLKK